MKIDFDSVSRPPSLYVRARYDGHGAWQVGFDAERFSGLSLRAIEDRVNAFIRNEFGGYGVSIASSDQILEVSKRIHHYLGTRGKR